MRPLTGLVTTVGTRSCVIPIEHVVETMRPLPIEGIANAPSFVLGIAIVRGEPVVVMDASALLGAARSAPPSRFVTMRVEDRTIALAVDAVSGVATLDARFESLPALLRAADVIDAIAPLDERLLVVLRAARVVEAAPS